MSIQIYFLPTLIQLLNCIYFRIVSAYEDRIMDPNTKLGHDFREKHGEPTFPNFVDEILEVRISHTHIIIFKLKLGSQEL